MSFDITLDAVIGCPVAVVSAFVSNLENVPRWCIDVEAVEGNVTRPLVVGSQVAFVARIGARRFLRRVEIREFVPETHLVLGATDASRALETTYTWRRVSPCSTRMTIRNRSALSGLPWLLSPLLTHVVRSATRRDLERLQRVLS